MSEKKTEVFILPVKINKKLASKPCYVDEDIFLKLNNIKLYLSQKSKKGYPKFYKDGKEFFLSRWIMKPSKSKVVDHIDGDRFNNRRSNLRVCTNKENCRNRKTPINNKTGFKGVSWIEVHKKFLAGISVNRKFFSLGHFKTAEEAARAYDEAAKKYFGEYAKTNF